MLGPGSNTISWNSCGIIGGSVSLVVALKAQKLKPGLACLILCLLTQI